MARTRKVKRKNPYNKPWSQRGQSRHAQSLLPELPRVPSPPALSVSFDHESEAEHDESVPLDKGKRPETSLLYPRHIPAPGMPLRVPVPSAVPSRNAQAGGSGHRTAPYASVPSSPVWPVQQASYPTNSVPVTVNHENHEFVFTDLPDVDLTKFYRPRANWFNKSPNYAVGNDESWVDNALANLASDCDTIIATSPGRRLPARTPSSLRSTDSNPPNLHPDDWEISDLDLNEAEELFNTTSTLEEATQNQIRDYLDNLEFEMEDNTHNRTSQPKINLQDLLVKSGQAHEAEREQQRRKQQEQESAFNAREPNRDPGATYIWGGPIHGNQIKTHEKFGMCGLSWREMISFLYAPRVGGKPTMAVSRITPSRKTSKLLISDCILQYTLPETDFLGNYLRGELGLIGELGIQPVSYKLSQGGSIVIDRTFQNGITMFDYRGDMIPRSHQFDATKPDINFGRQRQFLNLETPDNWHWFLENFFTLPSTLSTTANKRTGGLQMAPHHVRLPPVVGRWSTSTPASSGERLMTEEATVCGDLESLLLNYKPRKDLPRSIGNIVISVPLNQGRLEYEWERLEQVRAQEQKFPAASRAQVEDSQAKWYLLNAPVAQMKWVKCSVKNIYNCSTSDKGEDITQADIISFSKRLWLDLAESLSGKSSLESEAARAARIAKNRAAALPKKTKNRETSYQENVLDEKKSLQDQVQLMIEEQLKKDGLPERSEWDKLSTGWVVSELLDNPDLEEYCEELRKRFEEELKAGSQEKTETEEQADHFGKKQGEEGDVMKEEEETYLVLEGCTLSDRDLYNAFASKLAQKQDNMGPYYHNLSCSNLVVCNDNSQWKHDPNKVGILGDAPIPTHRARHQQEEHQHAESMNTRWQDLGGVRRILEQETLDRNRNLPIDQTFMVVMALVPNAMDKTSGLEDPMPIELRTFLIEAELTMKNKGYTEPQAREYAYHEGIRRLIAELYPGTAPEPGGPNINEQGGSNIKAPAPPPTKPITNISSTLANRLSTHSYKVVAVYPSTRACTYCNRVINAQTQSVVRCCETNRNDPSSLMSQPHIPGGQYVHARDPEAVRAGCRCNEVKTFHGLDVCYGHCQFCSMECKKRQDEVEQTMGEVWTKMVECFERGYAARERLGVVAAAAAGLYEPRNQWSGEPPDPSFKGAHGFTHDPHQISIVPDICFNWPGGWAERVVQNRRRDMDEKKAEIEKAERKGKHPGVINDVFLPSIDYSTNDEFGAGWSGTLKKGGVRVPWHGGWGTETVWDETLGGRDGILDRLYGSVTASSVNTRK